MATGEVISGRQEQYLRTAGLEKMTHEAVDRLQIWHRITVCSMWNNCKSRIFKEEFPYVVNLMDSYTELSEPSMKMIKVFILCL
jgi:hypothetical protein